MHFVLIKTLPSRPLLETEEHGGQKAGAHNLIRFDGERKKERMGGGWLFIEMPAFPFCSSFLHLDHIISDGWRWRPRV